MLNWGFWTIDLETLEAKLVEGLGWSSGGYYMSRVDGKNFVLAPNEDYASTSFYEVHTDGSAELRFTGEGWSMDLIKVR